MNDRLTRRDFGFRTVGFGLAVGLAVHPRARAQGASGGVAAPTPSERAARRSCRFVGVAGLPPAWIGVGSIDLFVEEDMAYAARLVHAGIATELVVEPGAFHGFDFFVPDAKAAQRFNASWKSALRRAFATAKAV